MIMMRRVGFSILLVAALQPAHIAGAHDLFLVVPHHAVPAHEAVEVALYNGTFESSDGTVARDRMADATVVDGDGEVTHPAAQSWREEGAVTILELETGEPGTHLIGVSTKPRMIELSAEDFDAYLEHDGVLDVLAARQRAGADDPLVRERYSKHVKLLLHVGDESSDTFRHRLGYPVEIVPLVDPAALAAGDDMEVLVLRDGEPLAEQLVYAGHAGYEPPAGGSGREPVRTRTDGEGVARFELSRPGRWYVRLISMEERPEEEIEYQSEWATLTFEVFSDPDPGAVAEPPGASELEHHHDDGG